MGEKLTKAAELTKLLNRPWYLPQPSREEIVGAALARLHEQLAPYRKPAGRRALEASNGQ